jgi:hypothetical protein
VDLLTVARTEKEHERLDTKLNFFCELYQIEFRVFGTANCIYMCTTGYKTRYTSMGGIYTRHIYIPVLIVEALQVGLYVLTRSVVPILEPLGPQG